jgi:hypothetical protein
MGVLPFGTPRRRYEYNIEIDFKETGFDGVDRIHVAQTRDHWQVLDIIFHLGILLYCKLLLCGVQTSGILMQLPNILKIYHFYKEA